MYGTEFRPLDFSSVIGLSTIKELIQIILKDNKLDTAYLFSGGLSSGKTTIARIFARSILCENRKEDQSPCNECISCKTFLDERNPAYTEIDAASGGGKEDIKELFEALRYESIAKKRIILFDECHNMSKEAKDTLLKKLEENNPNLIFIFCTTDVEKMPGNLRSRCLDFQFVQPSETDVVNKLEAICKSKNHNYEKDALYLISQASGKYYRFAENKLTLVSYLGDISKDNVNKVVNLYNESIIEMLLTLSYDISASLKICDDLVSKMNIKSIYESIIRIIVDTLKKINGCPSESPTYNDLLKKLEHQYGPSLYEVLNYILAKNKFTDVIALQSDLLLMHYKFLRDAFVPKESKEQEETPTKKAVKVDSSLEDIKNLPPWKREEAIREYKMKKISTSDKNTVNEVLTKEWSPEKDPNCKTVEKIDPAALEEYRKFLEDR